MLMLAKSILTGLSGGVACFLFFFVAMILGVVFILIARYCDDKFP